jgi:alpha/beta superfamily hydrolase
VSARAAPVLRPPRAERVTLEGPAGGLQALIETPIGPDGEPPPAPAFAVVCHPHPLYGGTMDNKVVYTVARALESLGAPAIRFNFRGVGTSTGQYDAARGETEDALAVIAHARQRWPQLPLWLAGFSFGGAVAVRAAGQARPERLIAVAPGITLISVAAAAPPACPWLIAQGSADEVVAPEAVAAWAHALAPAPQLRVLAGAGHFFHGRLHELRDVVLEFMAAPA